MSRKDIANIFTGKISEAKNAERGIAPPDAAWAIPRSALSLLHHKRIEELKN